MTVHYFDIAVGVIVLLLGLKGIFNGFFKEFFGLIGIIGGIFLASRFGTTVGTMASDAVFHFDNQSAITFTGFLLTLAFFWISMLLIGSLFKKLSHASGLGAIDKLMGFIVGSGKFFLITAVIVFSLNNIKAVHNSFASVMQTSLLFPVLIEVGDIIMHIDPTEATTRISEGVEEGIQKATDAAGNSLEQQVKEVIKGSSKAASSVSNL